jgi:hypothetical protein
MRFEAPTPEILDKAADTARKARLTGALMCCHEGRLLLEEARAKGIDFGGGGRNPQQASPLHLASTALFMIQDVYELCRQVRPFDGSEKQFVRAMHVQADLVKSANRDLSAEPTAKVYSKPKAPVYS